MNHVVSVGGGITSTYRLLEAATELHGTDNVHAAIACLSDEHPDLWRLVDGAQEKYGIEILRLSYRPAAKGLKKYLVNAPQAMWLSVWDVFDQDGIIGNRHMDVCSRKLKRETFRAWLLDNFKPEETTVHFGIEANEDDRNIKVSAGYTRMGFTVSFPLQLKQYRDDRSKALQCLDYAGFTPEVYTRPRASHLNCGGMCVKATPAQLAEVYYTDRATYLGWADREDKWRRTWQRNNTILLDDGNPITLHEFAEQLESGKKTFRRPNNSKISKLQQPLFEISKYTIGESTGCVYCESA